MIRKARPDDASAIATIYNEYVLHSVITFDTEPVTELSMRSLIKSVMNAHPFFVYEKDGTVKGFCYAHTWKTKAAYRQTWETTLYLAPDVRHQGIGTRLMLRLIEDSKRFGCRALIACITEGNEISEALHQKLGFRKVSHFEKVGFKFGRFLDVVDYELVL